MSLNISAFRSPVQDLANNQPLDLSTLNSKGAKHQGSMTGDSSLSEKGGSQLQDLFSTLKSSQVDFGPKNTQNTLSDSTDSSKKSSASSGTGDQQDILDQLMKVIQTAVMQWLQNMLQPKDDSSDAANSNKLAATGGSSSPAPATGGGDSGDGAGAAGDAAGSSGNQNKVQAPDDTGSSSPTSQADAVTPSDSSISGSDDLHLPPALEPYRADIQDAAKATGMPANVIAGMIWAESRGKLDAGTTNVNGKADSGLMQVNADTFAGLKKDNPDLLGNANVNDAHDNIMAGALYLRDQSKAFDGNMGAALRAYNSGPDKVNTGNLADTGGVGGASYPKDVLNFAQIIGSGQGQLPG